MSSDQTKKLGISLFINKSKPTHSREIKSVFGDEDSDDEKDQTPAERFQSKYGNLKAKDERAVKKVLEEDPNIYDYDGADDNIQRKKQIKIEEEESSKKVESTPRYMNRLLEAKKKRDLEKLLRDERKQEKERVTEGEEFKDKEVFITTAYRKQLEETVKFRKELEASDEVDDRTGVRGQQLWRENFGKKLLDERIKSRYGDDAVDEEKPDISKEIPIKEEKELSPTSEEVGKKSTRVASTEDDFKQLDLKRRDSDRNEHKKRRHDSTSHRDSDRHEHKKSRHDRKGSSYRDDEKVELKNRMRAIRKILKQRNGEEQIEAARQRYLERRNEGLIVIPV